MWDSEKEDKRSKQTVSRNQSCLCATLVEVAMVGSGGLSSAAKFYFQPNTQRHTQTGRRADCWEKKEKLEALTSEQLIWAEAKGAAFSLRQGRGWPRSDESAADSRAKPTAHSRRSSLQQLLAVLPQQSGWKWEENLREILLLVLFYFTVCIIYMKRYLYKCVKRLNHFSRHDHLCMKESYRMSHTVVPTL